MLEWRDRGTVLSVRRHGETAAILELFTAEHGRHLGVVRGGVGRRMRPLLQPGSRLEATWRARLDEHIGAYTVEPLRSSAHLMSDRAALAAVNAVTALLSFALPEREPNPRIFARTEALLDSLSDQGWEADYVRWELALLDEMGFGLDLSHCAVTGGREDLVYVSPKSGRAVSRAGAKDWADRLLCLPAFVSGEGPASRAEIETGLRLTGHFLHRWLAPELGDKPLPSARDRLVATLQRG